MKENFKVLIVEDEALTARSLQMDLEDYGVDALPPVAKGEEAVEAAFVNSPDLILMDVRLAGMMDGIEAAQQIIARQYTPIVFMTGFATDPIKSRAQKVKFLEFLEKPVDMHVINHIIDVLKKMKA